MFPRLPPHIFPSIFLAFSKVRIPQQHQDGAQPDHQLGEANTLQTSPGQNAAASVSSTYRVCIYIYTGWGPQDS